MRTGESGREGRRRRGEGDDGRRVGDGQTERRRISQGEPTAIRGWRLGRFRFDQGDANADDDQQHAATEGEPAPLSAYGSGDRADSESSDRRVKTVSGRDAETRDEAVEPA